MLFWQVVRMEMHAGYPERATALLQAMLEATLMRPDRPSSSCAHAPLCKQLLRSCGPSSASPFSANVLQPISIVCSLAHLLARAALVSAPWPSVLSELRRFWESDAPRIGEDDAEGWRAWYNQHPPEAGSV